MSMVSIVMATYNGEKYIGEQIESILASTYQDFNLFIYDDGSTDGTLLVLMQYENKYPDKIKIFQNEVNQGVTLNFLQGICKTTSDYIMLSDQDDVWKPNKIGITLRRMRHMEAQLGKELPMAVFTDAVVVDENLKTLQKSFFQSGKLDPTKTDLNHLLMENKLIGCSVMVNASLRKVLQGHHLPKEARLHDWWIALIASSFGKIGFIKEPTLLYRQHSNNVVGNQSFYAYFINRVSSLGKQRTSILALEKQAEEFSHLYQNILSEESWMLFQRFANLHNVNFIKRRILILQYGFMKTGLIRNIGLMIIV